MDAVEVDYEIVEQTTRGTRQSCTCGNCVKCCERRPGWMMPGEAEKIAAFLNLSMQELFDRYLIADFWCGGFYGNTEGEAYTEPALDSDVLVLSPAAHDITPGTRPRWSWGMAGGHRCVFLKEGQCSIHAVKPFECRESWCGDDGKTPGGGIPLHEQAARAWNTVEHQQQIVQLMRRVA